MDKKAHAPSSSSPNVKPYYFTRPIQFGVRQDIANNNIPVYQGNDGSAVVPFFYLYPIFSGRPLT